MVHVQGHSTVTYFRGKYSTNFSKIIGPFLNVIGFAILLGVTIYLRIS
jgi:hypothetical protein